MGDTGSVGTVCAVVVTYNIGSAFETCFNSIKGQADRIVIVNTSTDKGKTAKILERLCGDNPEWVVHLESPENNLGMAQNLGIAKALEEGYDWILLLDHDSRLGAGMVAAMLHIYSSARPQMDIGAIAPYLDDLGAGIAPSYVLPWHHYWFRRVQFDDQTPVLNNVFFAAASGCLIPRRVFDDGVRMDEGFIIDHIDNNFCLQIQALGYRIIAVRDAVLHHRIGMRKTHRILGMNVTTTNHPPFRHYYHNRNRVVLWKRYGKRYPGFLIFDMLRMAYELSRIMFLEKDKNPKLQAVFSGFRDGILGKHGAMPGRSIRR